jgi:hypothetical protein
MGLTAQPKVITYKRDGNTFYGVSFAYDFAGDTSIPQSVNGFNFDGSSYTLNMQGLPNQPTNFPAMKSLKFWSLFAGSSSVYNDGSLIVYCPQTQDQLIFSGPSFLNELTSVTLCGCVPITTSEPSQLVFIKSAATGDTMEGSIQCLLTSESLPSFIQSGLTSL